MNLINEFDLNKKAKEIKLKNKLKKKKDRHIIEQDNGKLLIKEYTNDTSDDDNEINDEILEQEYMDKIDGKTNWDDAEILSKYSKYTKLTDINKNGNSIGSIYGNPLKKT